MAGSASQPPAVCGAILAGGHARRFGGRDKSALFVDGRRIIERQLDALAPVAGDVFVVGGDPERYREFGLRVVPDHRPGLGPLAGLHAALTSATAPAVLVLACDLPLVDARFLAHLAGRLGAAEVAVPRDAGGWHPLCACYAARCAPKIAARLDAGLLKVVDALTTLERVEVGPDELSSFDPSGRLLTNVNSADDYAALTGPPARAPISRP